MGNAASYVPFNAAVGALSTDLICESTTSNGVLSYSSYDIVVAATGVLAAGAGQQVAYTDINGRLDLNSFARDRATSNGATNFTANYTLVFDALQNDDPNAAPKTFFTYSDKVSQAWTQPYLQIPAAGGVVPELTGSATLGAEGTITDFRLNNVTFDVLLTDASGAASGPSIHVTCGRNAIFSTNYFKYVLLSTISTGGAVSALPLAYGIGRPGTVTPKYKSRATAANIPLNCVQPYGQLTTSKEYHLNVMASGPRVALKNNDVNITDIQSFFQLPADAVSMLKQPGTYGYGITLGKGENGEDLAGPGYGLSCNNASPSLVDLARNNNTDGPSPLGSGQYLDYDGGNGQTVNFPLPYTGSLDLVGVTVPNDAPVGFSVTTIQGNVFIYDITTGMGVGNYGFVCTATPNVLLRAGRIN